MRSTIVPILALSLGALTCKRHGSDPPIVSDPAPHEPKTPPPPPTPGDASLVLLHARVIDPVSATVLHALEPTPPLPKLEASRGDVGYLQRVDDLEAFDLRAGKKLWSRRAACTAMDATSRGVLCASARVLDFYDATTGAHTTPSSMASADVMQILARGGHVLVLRGDGTLEAFDDPPTAVTATTTIPFRPVGYQPLAPNDRGACIASGAWHDVTLACYDASATLLYSKTYALAKPTDPSPTSFVVRQLDRRFLVASTWFGKGVHRGVVVRVSDGVEIARLEEQITSAVARDDGTLEGLVVTRPQLQFLEPSGATRWTSTVALDDATSVLSIDGVVVIASFHPIAAGATLHAFDLATGATRWTGDVELLPIAHSVYANDVQLTLRGGRVGMRGREAGQDYLELFEPRDGKRVLSELVGLW